MSVTGRVHVGALASLTVSSAVTYAGLEESQFLGCPAGSLDRPQGGDGVGRVRLAICSELWEHGGALELVALAGPHPGCHLIRPDPLVLLHVSRPLLR